MDQVKYNTVYSQYHLQISLANRSTWALVKDRFLRSTIRLWMSTGWLEISSNSGLFTRLDVPTEKNWILLCFSWSVSSFVYSNPKLLNPSVMTTTILFTSARRTVQCHIKLRTNGGNNSQHCWANNVGCCGALFHVAKSLTAGFQTLRNNTQDHATGCAKGRNM